MFRKIIVLLSILVLVTGASCAGPEPKSDYANEQVCQDLVLFVSSVNTLQDEAAFEDQTAISAQFDVVRKNFNSLVAAVQSLEVAEKEDFQNAVNDLLETAESLPQDSSVSDTIQALQEPIKNVVTAAENLHTGLECQNNLPNPGE